MTILIPGTNWQRHGGWGPDNALFAIAASAPFTSATSSAIHFFAWPGGNSDAARVEAAHQLRNFIASYAFAPNESLNIIAHSHGGNVALAASHLGLARPVNLLLTLNKPTRRARIYIPGPNIKAFYNLSARQDWLQWFGAGTLSKWPNHHATDKHATNHTFDTSASSIKSHAALIWDDAFCALWHNWFLQQHTESPAAILDNSQTPPLYNAGSGDGVHPQPLSFRQDR